MTSNDFKKLLDDALDPIRRTQKEQSETLETIQASVISIENTINGYSDMYKINNSNGKKLEKRIKVLEDNSGIIPPPEFTLADY